jgi:hypothetical protein
VSARWVPLLAEHLCLAFTWRSTIHASRDGAPAVAKATAMTAPGPMIGARTVCGVDAPPLVHGIVGRDAVLMATWPPPVHARAADRCEDCSQRLGLNGRQRVGDHHWQSLVDSDVVS